MAVQEVPAAAQAWEEAAATPTAAARALEVASALPVAEALAALAVASAPLVAAPPPSNTPPPPPAGRATGTEALIMEPLAAEPCAQLLVSLAPTSALWLG